jgi:hypothetical protein
MTSGISALAGAAKPAAGRPAGWLVGRGFDLHFILGIAALALASGWIVVEHPAMFVPILFLDLWLLGYHHVVATYTRLCFDRESLRTHRLLVFALPPVVFLAVVALATGVGPWALASVYLYWQWFHYTRQSYGIAQIYRRRSDGLVDDDNRISQLAIYLLPLWGILHRSHQAPAEFLGLELRVIPVPEIAVDIAAAAAAAAIAWWAWRKLVQWRRGRLPVAHTLYMLTHFAIFYVGYIVIDDLNVGWLVINMWHNAQYVAFVWMYNARRYKAGVDPRARFISTLSQPRNAWRYFAVCLAISTAIYAAIRGMFDGLAIIMVIYQTINYHHYIVDAVIWKVRRKPLRETLGLAH